MIPSNIFQNAVASHAREIRLMTILEDWASTNCTESLLPQVFPNRISIESLKLLRINNRFLFASRLLRFVINNFIVLELKEDLWLNL